MPKSSRRTRAAASPVKRNYLFIGFSDGAACNSYCPGCGLPIEPQPPHRPLAIFISATHRLCGPCGAQLAPELAELIKPARIAKSIPKKLVAIYVEEIEQLSELEPSESPVTEQVPEQR